MVDLTKLNNELLNIAGVTKMEVDGQALKENVLILVVSIDYAPNNLPIMEWFENRKKLIKAITHTISSNGIKIEPDEFEDNDTYLYIVSYQY